MTHPPYHIHWTDFVSIDVVRSRTGQLLLSDTIGQLPLSFFGHLCRADTGQDHSRAVRACIRGPPKDWRLRAGRPWHTWLKTVEDDLRPLNFGLATARRRAMDRPAWRLLVDAATSSWHAPKREVLPPEILCDSCWLTEIFLIYTKDSPVWSDSHRPIIM